MKFGNAIRKLAALGTGMTMVGATMMGALAAVDLSTYPKMFMKDNALNAVVVVGSKAAPIDIVGAVDVAFSLQAAAVTTKDVETGGKTVVTGDGKIEASGNHLNLGEAINAIQTEFTEKDLPVLLADGLLEDNDNEEYDYSQEIGLTGDLVEFYQKDDVDAKLPKFYINHEAGEAYTVTIDFKQDVDFVTLDDSEKLVFLGKTFTVDQGILAGDGMLTLYASDKTEIIKVLEKKTITLADGTKLEIECTDANSELDTATLVVNGVLRKAEAGNTITAAGQSIYISKVFTGNIPTPTAQVEFFIGSNKVEIPVDGEDNVEVDGETLEGYFGNVVIGDDLTEVEQITFRFVPSDLDPKEKQYLAMGESLVDPLFGTFKMEFQGATPDAKSKDKTKISLARTGDSYDLTFTNTDGETFTIDELYTSVDDAAGYGENIPTGVIVEDGDDITDEQIFIVEDGDITKVYQLTNVKEDNDVDYAEIKDLSDGSKDLYEVGDTLGDWTIATIVTATDVITLDTDTLDYITTEFDGVLTLEAASNLLFTEADENFERTADAGDAVVFNITIAGETDDEKASITRVVVTAAADADVASDDDSNVEYGISKLGTYYELETDKEGAYLDIYYPEEQVEYNVFIAPVGASASTTGANTVQTQVINKVNIGASKLDTEVTAWEQNVIAIGGPCVNTVSSELMGAPAVCTANFAEGKAYIKLFEKGDKVAMMVAGWAGPDTRRATTVLAKYDTYAAQLKGTEVVVTGTTLSDITVSAPITP